MRKTSLTIITLLPLVGSVIFAHVAPFVASFVNEKHPMSVSTVYCFKEILMEQKVCVRGLLGGVFWNPPTYTNGHHYPPCTHSLIEPGFGAIGLKLHGTYFRTIPIIPEKGLSYATVEGILKTTVTLGEEILYIDVQSLLIDEDKALLGRLQKDSSITIPSR